MIHFSEKSHTVMACHDQDDSKVETLVALSSVEIHDGTDLRLRWQSQARFRLQSGDERRL